MTMRNTFHKRNRSYAKRWIERTKEVNDKYSELPITIVATPLREQTKKDFSQVEVFSKLYLSLFVIFREEWPSLDMVKDVDIDPNELDSIIRFGFYELKYSCGTWYNKVNGVIKLTIVERE